MNDMAKALDQLMVTHKYLKPEVIQEWNYTPEDILEALAGIEYGWSTKTGKRTKEIKEEEFYNKYALQSPEQVWVRKVGVCWDVVELSRVLFLATKLEFVPIYVELCPGDTHTFIVFKDNREYFIFEYSFGAYRGIHGSYKDLPQAVNVVIKWMLHEWRDIDVGVRYTTKYPIMRSGIGCQEFMDVAKSALKVSGVKTQNVMFHASHTQGLKKLDPKRSVTSPGGDYDGLVYVTPEICYAAGFCIPFSDREGFAYGQRPNIDHKFYYMRVPKKFADRLEQPASIYLVENKNIRHAGHSLPEYISDKQCKVVEELRFKTARECMETYGVEIIIK